MKKDTKRYKKQIFTIISTILLFYSIFGSIPVRAWDNCPFGEINEPYPGTCGRYTDSDQDNICDLSQSHPNDRIDTLEETINQQQNVSTNLSITSNTNARINYYFVPILIISLIFYTLTYALSKKKKIKLNKHRKIWNIILLITFLVSGIFGLMLAISISLGIRLDFYATLLFWHVEFGIAMAIISIFHIGWHWTYYKKILAKK